MAGHIFKNYNKTGESQILACALSHILEPPCGIFQKKWIGQTSQGV